MSYTDVLYDLGKAEAADAPPPLLTRFSEFLNDAISAANNTLDIQSSMMNRIWGPHPTSGISTNKEATVASQAEMLSDQLIALNNLLREIRDNAARLNSAL